MGTNFYYTPRQPCESCARPYDRVHIGKRAKGFKFMVQAQYRGQEWTDVTDSLSRAVLIEDENGVEYTFEEMLEIVKNNQTGKSQVDYDPEHSWYDPQGFVMCSGEWH